MLRNKRIKTCTISFSFCYINYMKTIPPNETHFILFANQFDFLCLKTKIYISEKKVKYSNKISYVIMIDNTVISSKGFSTSTRLYYWKLRGGNHEKDKKRVQKQQLLQINIIEICSRTWMRELLFLKLK